MGHWNHQLETSSIIFHWDGVMYHVNWDLGINRSPSTKEFVLVCFGAERASWTFKLGPLNLYTLHMLYNIIILCAADQLLVCQLFNICSVFMRFTKVVSRFQMFCLGHLGIIKSEFLQWDPSNRHHHNHPELLHGREISTLHFPLNGLPCFIYSL